MAIISSFDASYLTGSQSHQLCCLATARFGHIAHHCNICGLHPLLHHPTRHAPHTRHTPYNRHTPELMVAMQGFHVVLSDMCHSTMGSSSADVLRSLDLASCAAELAVGSLEPDPHPSHHFPPVHNPLPAQASTSTQQQSSQPQAPQQPSGAEQDSGRMDGSNGLLLPKGNLVMKLLQVR